MRLRSPQRRRAKSLRIVMRNLEGLIRDSRRGQTAGDPKAEALMNEALDGWSRIRDVLALEEAYGRMVTDRQSPNYHG